MSVAISPRPAATLMLLRDGVASPEVLLLRRASSTPFVPGAHVFPGGALEPSDGDAQISQRMRRRHDAEASEVLQIPGGGLSYWVAAVRECLEEAGVVLAASADDGSPVAADSPAAEAITRLRSDIENGQTTLGALYEEYDLVVPADEIAYVSHWITPEVSARRYDTRFFAATMPEGQQVRVDRWEAIEATWWTPADALAANDEGEIDLIEPTVSNIELLAGFTTADAALAAFRAGEQRSQRVLDPRGGFRISLPDEPDHDHPQRAVR